MIDSVCLSINQNFKIWIQLVAPNILVSAYKRIIDWWRVANYEKRVNGFCQEKDNLNDLKNFFKRKYL
jgi:hypothetical protein